VGITTAACPEDEALLMTIRACAFETLDEEGDPWWCEEVVTEEEKSFVTQSTDSPWTEVMSVKGTSVMDAEATAGVTGGGGPKYDVSAVSSMGGLGVGEQSPMKQVGEGRELAAPSVPVAVALSGLRMTAAAVKVNDLGAIAMQPTSSVTDVVKPPPMSPKRNMRRRDDSWDLQHGDGFENDNTSSADGSEHAPFPKEPKLPPRDLSNGTLAAAAPCIPDGKRLRIIDARPIMNAKGNALMGKGHEIIARLGGESCTSLSFAGIANIHAMRESYGALRQICCELTQNGNWLQMVHETKWLHHLSVLIRGSVHVALHLESGDPVLVHCSDGWDRTAQMVALAQLMLDPHYRTIAGDKVCVNDVYMH
jgi:hypothetical protein